MIKEGKATRYVQDKMFPHIVNAVRQEEPCFSQYDLREAYLKGWSEAVLDIKNGAESKIKEADEYAKRKITEAFDFICRNYNDTINELLKDK